VQIDIDPRHIGVTRPLALGIVADVKPSLASLASALETRRARPRDPGFLARCRRAADEWWKEQMGVVESWAGPGLHPARVMQAIGTAFGREPIYVTDGGFTSLWAYWFLPPTRPRSYLSILELGMLGTGVPSALGAKLGNGQAISAEERLATQQKLQELQKALSASMQVTQSHWNVQFEAVQKQREVFFNARRQQRDARHREHPQRSDHRRWRRRYGEQHDRQ